MKIFSLPCVSVDDMDDDHLNGRVALETPVVQSAVIVLYVHSIGMSLSARAGVLTELSLLGRVRFDGGAGILVNLFRAVKFGESFFLQ